MEEKELQDGAQLAVHLATEMLKECEKSEIPPVIAYAAFGNAFTRLHTGLGKTKEDFMEIANRMSELLDGPRD